MKKHLKRLATAAFAVLVIGSSAFAQDTKLNEKTFNHKLAFAQFELCLQRSDVPGFVESTLYTIVQCKDRFPNLDYSAIQDAVNKVARDNDNSTIAYKAYLVSMYLSHTSQINVTPSAYENVHDQLFKQIADQLEAKFLAFDGTENAMVSK